MNPQSSLNRFQLENEQVIGKAGRGKKVQRADIPGVMSRFEQVEAEAEAEVDVEG